MTDLGYKGIFSKELTDLVEIKRVLGFKYVDAGFRNYVTSPLEISVLVPIQQFGFMEKVISTGLLLYPWQPHPLRKAISTHAAKKALRDHPLITNRYNQKLDRDGVSYMVHKYAEELRKEDPSFPEKVICHMFRHSKGMHMLAAGINIVYIRDFLGHEDISVTMVYAKADNRLKMKLLTNLLQK